MKNIVLVGLFLWVWWLHTALAQTQQDIKDIQTITNVIQEDGTRL